mgnify:CR=1 FL=1
MPVAAAVSAMGFIQVGASIIKGLFPVVGAQGATLLRFRPRWRAEFLLSVDNDSGSRQGFCVETSAGPEPLRVEPGAGAQPGPAGG